MTPTEEALASLSAKLSNGTILFLLATPVYRHPPNDVAASIRDVLHAECRLRGLPIPGPDMTTETTPATAAPIGYGIVDYEDGKPSTRGAVWADELSVRRFLSEARAGLVTGDETVVALVPVRGVPNG